MVDRTKGRRPKNRPCDSGDDSDPGLATQRDRDLTATQRGTLEPAWVLHQGEGTQRPQCVKEKGPENPDVAAPLAAAGCRGNCWCAGRVFSVVRRWTTTSRLPRPLRVVPHEPSSTFHDGDGGRHATVLVERGLSRASGVRVCSPCRAHLFALDVILCAPISLFAFVAESAKARLRRHGPELHRCVIVCRLRLFLSYCSWRLAGLHFYSSVYQGKLKYFSRREEVSLPLSHPARGIWLRYDLGLFSHIFINGAHGISGVFKVARRQWRVADGQCRARPQTWWSDFVRFPDAQRASSEGFQVHVADSSCSLSLRDHCDGHWETSVLAQLRRGSLSWCSYVVSQICSVC